MDNKRTVDFQISDWFVDDHHKSIVLENGVLAFDYYEDNLYARDDMLGVKFKGETKEGRYFNTLLCRLHARDTHIKTTQRYGLQRIQLW